MSEPTFLGKLTITISRSATGQIAASHETELSPALEMMQSAMSEPEKLAVAGLRRQACRLAADFFLAIRDPDEPEEAAG